MQPFGKKLQLKSEQEILLLHAPKEIEEAFATEGYSFKSSAVATAITGNAYDAVQLFVKDKEELNRMVPNAIKALKKNGMLWIAYPKKSSKIKSDLTRDEGWKTVFEMGYEAVRQISIDETWSSLRFKHKSERTTPSKFGAAYEGIDKATRTVTAPEDMQEALQKAGLLERFQKLSFTHKKEYVVAVLEAKRPETRIKRIEKTLEQVAALANK